MAAKPNARAVWRRICGFGEETKRAKAESDDSRPYQSFALVFRKSRYLDLQTRKSPCPPPYRRGLVRRQRHRFHRHRTRPDQSTGAETDCRSLPDRSWRIEAPPVPKSDSLPEMPHRLLRRESKWMLPNRWLDQAPATSPYCTP